MDDVTACGNGHPDTCLCLPNPGANIAVVVHWVTLAVRYPGRFARCLSRAALSKPRIYNYTFSSVLEVRSRYEMNCVPMFTELKQSGFLCILFVLCFFFLSFIPRVAVS